MKYIIQLPEEIDLKYLNKSNKDRFIIKCKYLKLQKLGISFCTNKKKGFQKSKNNNIIGTCYSIFHKHKIHDYKLFETDIMAWAVSHLQYHEESNKELAYKIVHHMIT